MYAFDVCAFPCTQGPQSLLALRVRSSWEVHGDQSMVLVHSDCFIGRLLHRGS